MSNQTTTNWTDDRIERLIRLRKEGYSSSQIAFELGGGLTRNSVIGKVHRLRRNGVDVGIVLPAPQKDAPRVRRAEPAPKVTRITTNNRMYRTATIKPLPVFEPDDELEAADLVDDGTAQVLFLDRQQDQCAHIMIDEPVMCCGRPVGLNWRGERSSYCQAHHDRFYIPPKPPGKERPHWRKGRA